MICFYLLFTLFTTVYSQVCPYSTDKVIGSRCYMFVSKTHTFGGAQKYCHGYGYSLATVDSTVISSFLASLAISEFGKSHDTFWIGLSRKSSHSLFTWDDDTQFGYSNFASGYPNTQDYVAEKTNNGKWETLASAHLLPFVCSRPVGVTTTTSTTSTTTSVVSTSTNVAITTTPRTTCPDNFTLIGTKCYIVVEYGHDSDYPSVSPNDLPLTAEQYRCDKVGATLVSIHSKDVEDQLNKIIFNKFEDFTYVTIGLRNLDPSVERGNWKWSDNSTVDYTLFEDSFPRSGDLITQISFKGTWVTYRNTSPSEGVVCSMYL